MKICSAKKKTRPQLFSNFREVERHVRKDETHLREKENVLHECSAVSAKKQVARLGNGSFNICRIRITFGKKSLTDDTIDIKQSFS